MNTVKVGDVWRKRGPCDWIKVVRLQFPGVSGYDGGLRGCSVRLRNWRKGTWHGRNNIPVRVPPRDDHPEDFKSMDDGLLDCVICLMPWVAALFYGLWIVGLSPVVYIFAAAGLALWMHGYTGWRINM